jgi:hypothetical protein
MDKNTLNLQQRALDEANGWAERAISTWADLYGMLHARMRAFHSAPDQSSSEMALFSMYAFVLALEALPDEGNALVIVKKMNHIMFMEPERLGARITVIDQEDVVRAAQVLSALGMMTSTHGETVTAPQEEPEPGTETPPAEASKKMLH